MNQHFPPPALRTAEPHTNEPLELSLHEILPSDRQALQDEAKPGDENKKGITRRGVLAGILGAGALAATPKIITSTVSQGYDIALLRQDPNSKALGLAHRHCSATDKEATIDSATHGDVITGADENRFSADGKETLVVSPEIFFDPTLHLDTKPEVTRAQLHGVPENLFLPYHLFAGAGSFNVRIKTNAQGQEKLCFEIAGPPTVRQVPILQRAKEGISSVAHGAKQTFTDGLGRAWAVLQDGVDSLFSGEAGPHEQKTIAEQQRAAADYAVAQPHHIAQTTFSIEVDYKKGHVPNLYFFNGHTLANPTYCLPGMVLERLIPPEPRTEAEIEKNPNGRCFQFMPGAEMICNYYGTAEDGCRMAYAHADKFFDPVLVDRIKAAELETNRQATQGAVKAVLGYLGDKALGDDQLNGFELGALNLAARCEQAVQVEQNKGYFGTVQMACQRLGLGTPNTRATPREISQGIERS